MHGQSLNRVWLFATLRTVACQTLFLDFPGMNTGASSHLLLQGIFLNHGLNPDLLQWQQILHHWATQEAQQAAYIHIKRI